MLTTIASFGERMPYFIKWVGKDGAAATPAMRFLSIAEALDFAAAAVLSQNPKDIWVEDERGCPVADMARISRHSEAGDVKRKPNRQVEGARSSPER